MAHLAALGELARTGIPTAVVFVVQRGDVEVLDVAAPAEPGWVAAVRGARRAGVHVVAHRCEVGTRRLALGATIPVRDRGRSA